MPICERVPRHVVLMFCAAIILIVVLLGTVAWTFRDARMAVRRQAELEAGNIAVTLERDIGRMIGSVDLALRAGERGEAMPALATLDAQTRQAVLFNGAIGAEEYGSVMVADAAGQVTDESPGSVPGRVISIFDRDFFQAHLTHPDLGLVISEPLRGRTDGQTIIVLSRRISRPDGAFAGVVAARIPISSFGSLFSPVAIGEHGVIALVDSNRRLIIARRPHSGPDFRQMERENSLFTLLPQAAEGNFESISKADGVRRLYSYRKVAGLPLVIVVGLSSREVFAEWLGKTRILGSILGLLSAVVLAMAWLLPRELRRRLRAEAAHSQAAARLDAVFRNSADAMLVVRHDPPGTYVYEDVNPVWERLTQVPASAAVGKTPSDILPPALAATVLAGWQHCVQERRTARFGLTIAAADGDYGGCSDWEAVAVPIIGESEAIHRLVVVGRDVTERNRLEGELRQAQKMQIIGQLAAGVAHDFNNILQVIGGGLEMLTTDTAVSPEGKSFLDMSGAAVRRGAFLTQHLLSYARKQILDPQLLDPGTVIETLQVLLSRTLGSHIAIAVAVAPGVGAVRVDRSQLETALINFAINAGHAMPSGGTLRLEVTTGEGAPFGELQPGRHVVIAVTDTGTGMSQEVLGRVFEPFFSTKGVDGTGLGLAMVQGFARQSGGDVRVMSTSDKGTCFELWLPEAAPAGAEPALTRQPPTGEQGHVLLVDDFRDVMIIADAYLRSGGYRVRQAPDGHHAVAALAAGERFDLIVTDYMMAGLNGVELIRRARDFQPDLPAIIISGFADVTDFVSNLPDTTVLLKPFKRDQLLQKVGAVFARPARIAGHIG